MLKQSWILMFLSVGITALAPARYETDVESLKSALNAVKRKQITLEPTSQEYYNDFRSRKYHEGNVERNFEMERQNDRVLPDENEKLEFLPNENGQLEMVDDEFQGINDKMLEKSILNYLMNAQEQERVPSSLFRERERSSSHKRANVNDDIDFHERANFILEQLRNSDPSALKELEENYLDVPISEKYGMNQGKKIYENESPMSWSELFDKGDFLPGEGARRNGEENDFTDKDMEQDILYFLPTERRNINARYPLGRQFDKYRTLGKRYPVAKRSPKEFQQMEKQMMDPKVAQDLGALFGAQSALKTRNYTRAHNHEHEDEDEHEHEHEHEHETMQNENENDNIRIDTTEAPKVKPTSKGQKENVTKINTSNGKSIEVKKKSVDWSQYFGIDRRKKKTIFLARPDTQDQDDEWMLQRYYENMAENLKHPEEESETESNDKKDKIERMYTMLSDISTELEKERDYIINKLAAAYSYKKIRKALDGLHNILAIQKEIQNNLTQNFRNDGTIMKSENKRTGFNAGTKEASDVNKKCPDLEKIERHCKAAYNFAGDNNQMFYFPCVTYQICKACVPNETEEECLTSFALEAAKACDAIVKEKGIYKELQFCIDTILSSMKLQPSIGISEQCRVNRESCLRRYHSRYRHRYPSFPFYVDFLFRRDSDLSQTSD
ncbi:PREDICTED: uncharacterized protein LOC106789278 [Polistes canadensis]|uniref:uncharacterized protein LOC106789278 n=1 Tax=Polistes canadensis TaxID=91411 RepID=UPI000718C096|nr:PREDICTED: uncharacterized protein LOC106789278 [Polistes canadensis]